MVLGFIFLPNSPTIPTLLYCLETSALSKISALHIGKFLYTPFSNSKVAQRAFTKHTFSSLPKETYTPVCEFSILPSFPLYCLDTPTACFPDFFDYFHPCLALEASYFPNLYWPFFSTSNRKHPKESRCWSVAVIDNWLLIFLPFVRYCLGAFGTEQTFNIFDNMVTKINRL